MIRAFAGERLRHRGGQLLLVGPAGALRAGPFSKVAPVLKGILASNAPSEIQAAAAESLGSFSDPNRSAVLPLQESVLMIRLKG